ncbi:MAG: ribonuclease HI [Bacteroidota bacterium]|nr:ribonuclease HI [Bacteroidota bacterium]
MAIEIYTDGSAKGNPGKGGYGIVIKNKDNYLEISNGYRLTTNNRMELLAVIVALEKLENTNEDIIITSDSKYVIDAVTKGWVFNWQRKGFKKKKNSDLWKRFLKVHHKYKIKFVWVPGHSGHIENERCDELAVDASTHEELEVDVYFENSRKEPPSLFN